MFTLKVCNPGMTTYYETDKVSKEVLDNNRWSIRFHAKGQERHILIRVDSDDPDEISCGHPVAERIYVINENGQVLDIFE